MAFNKSFVARQRDQAKAKEKLAEQARKLASRPIGSKKPEPEAISPKPAPATPTTPEVKRRDERLWRQVRVGSAPLEYCSRAAGEQVWLQPWTKGLVNTLLEAADLGGVALCLIWPAKLNSLAPLHALANVERFFARDLRGLRTLLYPGTHASKAALQETLADRVKLSELYRSLWVMHTGSTEIATNTSSPAFLAALAVLNDIELHNPEVPHPSLAELVPAFVFDPSRKDWITTVTSPLERTLKKVEALAHRRDLRQKVETEWSNALKAPGALMVLHNTARKEAWREALKSRALQDGGRPEVLLLDATTSAMQTNYAAVKRIPDFLEYARSNGLSEAGAVVVTDDPKTFSVLRAQLSSLRLPLKTFVSAAEADKVLLSPEPVGDDWKPEVRSNSNFNIDIVDRDASQLAMAFQRLASAGGGDEGPAHQAMIDACLYILRLSNMPAGYSDLTAAASEQDAPDFASQRNAWAPLSLRLQAALASGAFNHMRPEVEKTIRKTEQLIDNWNDATPMALRLLAEVRQHAVKARHKLVIVLPNNKYVQLAHRFLSRKLDVDWSTAEERLEWHTLSSIGKTLTGHQVGKHFVFVGMNPDVLRILVTHPDIPHGTAVLIAYRQAESTLTTLTSIKEVEAFQAYKGRMGLLAQALEKRLKEIPNPLIIGKLREFPMTFNLDEGTQANGNGGEQAYFSFELEGGGHAYASGWVYRYFPDEDPFFRRVPASSIQTGEFIFEMSDELRAKIEASLMLNTEGFSSVVDPVRMLLKLYHNDVQTRCSLFFKSTKRSALAREIHTKMLEIDPGASSCRPARVYYWLDLKADGDTRPHASKDAKFFKLFCKALEINDADAEQYWMLIRNARLLSQYVGRELVARYAEILFKPESAVAYRKVTESVIEQLQQEALSCVFRVEHVAPPALEQQADRRTNGRKNGNS